MQVKLGASDELELRACLLPQLLSVQVRCRERVTVTVLGDGERIHAVLDHELDVIFWTAEPIIGRHPCVIMKTHESCRRLYSAHLTITYLPT